VVFTAEREQVSIVYAKTHMPVFVNARYRPTSSNRPSSSPRHRRHREEEFAIQETDYDAALGVRGVLRQAVRASQQRHGGGQAEAGVKACAQVCSKMA